MADIIDWESLDLRKPLMLNIQLETVDELACGLAVSSK
jgi:hypothetical protein